MPLSNEEKSRIYYHLGWPQVDALAVIQFGMPAMSQPMWLIATALERVQEVALPKLREVLKECDDCEKLLSKSRKYLVAESLGELKLRAGHQGLIRKEYQDWVNKVCDILGATMNVYSARFRYQASGGGVNVPVRRS